MLTPSRNYALQAPVTPRKANFAFLGNNSLAMPRLPKGSEALMIPSILNATGLMKDVRMTSLTAGPIQKATPTEMDFKKQVVFAARDNRSNDAKGVVQKGAKLEVSSIR